MAKEGNSMMGVLIIGFIALVIGISFLVSLTDTTKQITDSFSITNESVAGKLNVAVNLANGNLTSVSAVRNTTGSTVPATNYTVSTTAGTITMLAPQVNNTYYVDYGYYEDTYVSDAPSRSLINVTNLLFAIGVLAVAIGIGYKYMKDYF